MSDAVIHEYLSVSETRRRGPQKIDEPGSGIVFALVNRIGWANHVHEDHGLHAPQVARKRETRSQFAAPISIVWIGPIRN